MVVIVQALAQGHAFGVLGVFAQMHIVPTGGVLEKVDHADRVGGFPAIFEPDVRREFTNRVLKGELALTSEFQDGKRRKSLGSGADAEQGFVGGGVIRGNVGLAKARNPFRAITMHNGDGHARGVGVGQDLLQLLPQLRNGLRRFGCFFFLVLGKNGSRREAEQEHDQAGWKTPAKHPSLHSQSPCVIALVRRNSTTQARHWDFAAPGARHCATWRGSAYNLNCHGKGKKQNDV
jgi:hypothetical protein